MGFRNREGITLRTATGTLALVAALAASPAIAAFLSGTNGDDVIFGADDDNVDNLVIQQAGAVNQSLNNTDAIDGKDGDDVLIGGLGSDMIRGGRGNDVIIGGTEQGSQPNSDVMFGDDGNDVSLWRGGDGSEAFIGGRGLDALVFGNIDRDANNIPILSPATGRHAKTGLPSADVTGQGGFCTLEDVRGRGLGYEFPFRFFVRTTGNLAVTVRTAEVEQMFCTSQAGGAITFADLTARTRNSSGSLSMRSGNSIPSSARSSADPMSSGSSSGGPRLRGTRPACSGSSRCASVRRPWTYSCC